MSTKLSKRIWNSNSPWFWVKFYKHFAKVECLGGNIEIEILKSAANCYSSREWRHFSFFQSSIWLIKLSKQNSTKKMKQNWEMQKIHQNWGTLFHILALKNWRQKKSTLGPHYWGSFQFKKLYCCTIMTVFPQIRKYILYTYWKKGK